jgi:hypothetical protein
MAVLNNVIIDWCKIKTPDVYLGKSSWQVNATVSKEQAAALVEAGAKPKKGEKLVFQFKRACKWPSGDDQDEPRIVDMNKTPMDCLVGNGSKANLQYKLVEVSNSFGNFVLQDLCAIQIISLVEYGVEDAAEFEAENDEFGTGTDVSMDTGGEEDPF